MSKQEKIVCAAVEAYVIPVENWYASPFTHVFKVVNHEDYKEEEIYSYLEILDEPVFGFFTNKNRFVDPKEAMKIAIEARQFEYLAYKDIEVRLLERQGFSTSAKISEKLKSEWIDVVSERALKPEDLY